MWGQKDTILRIDVLCDVGCGFYSSCLIFEKEGNIDSIRNIVKVANIGTGALVGLAAGPLWVSSQAYVSLCANESNKG